MSKNLSNPKNGINMTKQLAKNAKNEFTNLSIQPKRPT